jgi:hypothetical protein
LGDLNHIIDEPLPLNGSIESIVNTAKQILNIPDEERKTILYQGQKLINDEYNLRINMKNNIEKLLEADKY